MPELLASLPKAFKILPFKRIKNAMHNPKDHDTETHTDIGILQQGKRKFNRQQPKPFHNTIS
jgi:hypothetical protein